MAGPFVRIFGEALWCVAPTATPRVERRCSRCDARRRFVSADRFRVNAQQHRLDVWLIYRCEVCDATWNHELHARCTKEELGDALYARYLANDLETAWRHAFDAPALRANSVRVEEEVPFAVHRALEVTPTSAIRLVLARPCVVRLDRVLSAELGVSRSGLQRMADEGRLDVDPPEPRALRRPVRSGQLVRIQ